MESPVMLKEKFIEVFGRAPERVVFAPGRVNLIGEHTDYNGGHVMPCALDRGTLCAAARRDDGRLRFYSVNIPEAGVAEAELSDIAPLAQKGWTAYPMGVLGVLREGGHEPESGMDMMFWGDIPAGAGLSSSAAIEVAAGLAAAELFGFELTGTELALIGQRAENRYVGMNCGIMDQFASANGREGCAMYLDTSTLDCRYVPLMLGGAKLLIVNSRVKHSLAGSAYNDRRRECEEALRLLQTRVNRASLCAMTPEEFEANSDVLRDPVLLKRARHAVSENARTLRAAEALEAGDLNEFGRLMNESHISLRDDYEVSCRELDVLTDTAWSIPGVLGARMTGGGFGGCMVCLVEEEREAEFIRTIRERYLQETGITAEIYEAAPGEGAHVIE